MTLEESYSCVFFLAQLVFCLKPLTVGFSSHKGRGRRAELGGREGGLGGGEGPFVSSLGPRKMQVG